MTDAILVLNGGSSSLKFAVFERRGELPLLLRGNVSSLGQQPRLRVEAAAGRSKIDKSLGEAPIGMGKAFAAVAFVLAENDLLRRIDRVGHRIVHGGRDFTEATLLDERTLKALRLLEPLAPIHQRINLEIVALAAEILPQALQVGCFDTAFHSTRPELAKIYGLPCAMTDAGIVSYGFHGLSYSHIAAKLRDRYGAHAGGRAIVAHLGSGASLCAMAAGRSIATTMGFSTLDGLVMSTRCGALDPGIILHLLQERRLSGDEMVTLLYEQSGLLGVSGISGDMRTLIASDDPAAAEAVALFVYRIGREIGSLAAAMGGLDTLVFTAGIGENAPLVRERICGAAAWLGVDLDEKRNREGEELASNATSRVDVLVIPADEECAVAAEMLVF
ncbi:acetate/propionate family kinase [Mesorhizobium sp. M8A.F.Ca.ET.208.01.1.1]|uniref:acetate/propionate family kinase n=1 Tax=unclassified Mesorhizobium TaxID=325217 RepID=UPI000FD55587|nr:MULTISPECIES: acetate/propionate family kinase [unclassified Mesorhizobium]RUX07011.1 acetate/propionate family kinase [Mesorhizobium sp. M8A.F.Ca.ET.059.01.1.1]RWC74231.1 MAG: acetate/propionate family kinase [Mesorhizobium sp.]RWC89328.1 MAG: acetate/propionate family kinase [Mesorhizobium sp.]TGQ89292.1 acetate/propionate family kinase [Mesorhizobium sp. M8A.F.Ca.ET.208.01.1.1]TGT50610.1 acetate/propionate family kinase [Mesorhizobium sp. M8A.F.Ca.ET.167.01.1.1]